jgi:hypothetical protein
MALFLKAKDCKVAIVLYHAKNVITHHNKITQSLSLPIVQVMKRHLVESLNSDDETILDPITDAFRNAAVEYVTNNNLRMRSIKHIVNNDSAYLFKCEIYNSVTEIFAIEVLSDEIINESMVEINVEKIFIKPGTANNHDLSVYYNGLKIDTLSAIVLIEYWNLHL